MPEAAMEPMLKKALRPTDIDNLLLLPAGRTSLDPGALLNSSKLHGLLGLLKTHADIVIIDSGPVLKVVETKALANAVDGTVLVVADSQTRRKAVQQVSDYFRGKPHNNLLGLVFNRVKTAAQGYNNYAYTGRDKVQKSGHKQVESAILSLAEVTDYLGVSEETARRWCEQGRLSAIKSGRSWSVRLEDLNEFVGAYQHDDAAEMSLSAQLDVVQTKSPNGQEYSEPETSDLRN
jgi:excisionase family DNA binding protein